MRLLEHVARMGEKKNALEVLAGNLKGRGRLEYLGVDGRIILKLILKNRMGECGLDSSG
jgi:hypothetical protein